MRKKSIEELQAELALESEALATLQVIYAEKVKQVRTNTALPPDIQARFLAEWETFYQQRVASIFRKDFLSTTPAAIEPGLSATPPSTPSSSKAEAAPPTKAPLAQPLGKPAVPLAAAAGASETNTGEDILGVNTDSWMNASESITYEQYNDGEPIVPSLMDSDKAKAPPDSLEAGFGEDQDSIDGYAATSGLKGLTEFMDFDLKKKKS